jgi:hypothetical protein
MMVRAPNMRAAEAAGDAGSAAWPNHWSTPMLAVSIASITRCASLSTRPYAPTTATRLTASSAADSAYGTRPAQFVAAVKNGVGVDRVMVGGHLLCLLFDQRESEAATTWSRLLTADSARRRTPLMSPVSIYAWRGS